MTMQADSELAGAYGYVPWIMKAPTVEEKLVVAQIVKDETRHAKVMYDLLQELGFDVEGHVGPHDQAFARRLDDPRPTSGRPASGPDKRVNIFYYPIDTWADFVMFNFCMDRGAGHQLEDVGALLRPLGPRIEGIFKEEKMHIRHGELWVKRLADDPATRDEADGPSTSGTSGHEHLRPTRQPKNRALPGARPQGPRQRRGAPGLLRRGPATRPGAGMARAGLEAYLGDPARGGPDPGLRGRSARRSLPLSIEKKKKKYKCIIKKEGRRTATRLRVSLPGGGGVESSGVRECPIRRILSLDNRGPQQRAFRPPSPR